MQARSIKARHQLALHEIVAAFLRRVFARVPAAQHDELHASLDKWNPLQGINAL